MTFRRSVFALALDQSTGIPPPRTHCSLPSPVGRGRDCRHFFFCFRFEAGVVRCTPTQPLLQEHHPHAAAVSTVPITLFRPLVPPERLPRVTLDGRHAHPLVSLSLSLSLPPSPVSSPCPSVLLLLDALPCQTIHALLQLLPTSSRGFTATEWWTGPGCGTARSERRTFSGRSSSSRKRRGDVM